MKSQAECQTTFKSVQSEALSVLVREITTHRLYKGVKRSTTMSGGNNKQSVQSEQTSLAGPPCYRAIRSNHNPTNDLATNPNPLPTINRT